MVCIQYRSIKTQDVNIDPKKPNDQVHFTVQLSSSDGQIGVIFYLDELTDVSEESEDEVKYVT